MLVIIPQVGYFIKPFVFGSLLTLLYLNSNLPVVEMAPCDKGINHCAPLQFNLITSLEFMCLLLFNLADQVV